MSITVDQISALVGRYTNSVVNQQANLAAPLVGKGVIKKIVKPDKVGIVNIKAGELSSIKFIADGAALPTGSNQRPVQGTYLPVALLERITIPRMASSLASSLQDGIDVVKEQMDTAGLTLGRHLERGIIGSQLASPAVQVDIADTTMEVVDASGFRVGMAFEVWNGGTAIEGTTEGSLLVVTNIARSETANDVITFSAAGGAGAVAAWLVSYTLHLRGSKDANAGMVSLADVCSTSSLYGVAATSNEWSGVSRAGPEPFTVGALREAITSSVRRRGEKPTHLLVNRKNEERYSNQLINNRRFMSGKMDAVGDANVEIEGIPLFLTENLTDAEAYLINQKDIKLHVFRDFAPDFDGGEKKGMNRGAVLVSDSSFVYDVQVWGAFNLRAERRNGCVRFAGLNG
jgi:hypothetical protein